MDAKLPEHEESTMPVSIAEKSLFKKLHRLFTRGKEVKFLIGKTSKENLLLSYLRRPPGWFDRHLSRFLEAGHCNAVTASVMYPECFEKLCRADELLNLLAKSSAEEQNEIFWSLGHQTHNFFLNAARMAMMGQSAQAYTLIRATIEHAAYACFLHKNAGTEIETIWLERENSSPARQRMRDTFTWGAVSAAINNKPARRLVRTLYNHCISFGSHPNPFGVVDHLSSTNYSYFVNDLERQAEVMKLVVQTALYVALLASEVLPTFLDEPESKAIFDELADYCRTGHRAG